MSTGQDMADYVMNSAVEWMNETLPTLSPDGQKRKQFYVHNTYWMSKVLLDHTQSEEQTMQNYLLHRAKLLKWPFPNRISYDDWKLLRFLIFPIHWKTPETPNGWHWSYAVVNVMERHVCHFNSRAESLPIHQMLLQHVHDIIHVKTGSCDVEAIKGWSFYDPKDDQSYPIQCNGWDCGVYTLLGIERTIRGLRYDMSPEDVTNYRTLLAFRMLRYIKPL